LYDNTKVKGDIAEMEALVFLSRGGYRVSIPFGENCPYDLVAESPSGKMYRVQVRWSTWHKDVLTVSLRATSKNYARTLDLSRIDVFLVFDGASAYVIPTDTLKHCKAYFSLRVSVPKNNQVKGVSWASSFKEALHLIP
jgi:hypothetical protein